MDISKINLYQNTLEIESNAFASEFKDYTIQFKLWVNDMTCYVDEIIKNPVTKQIIFHEDLKAPINTIKKNSTSTLLSQIKKICIDDDNSLERELDEILRPHVVLQQQKCRNLSLSSKDSRNEPNYYTSSDKFKRTYYSNLLTSNLSKHSEPTDDVTSNKNL